MKTEPAPNPAADWLDRITETLIPPTSSWPAAAELGVGQDLLAHLRDTEAEALKAILADLGADRILNRSPEDLTADLRSYETAQPAKFALLRQLAYLAYYAQPAVVTAIRAKGHDIQLAPQPRGYTMPTFPAGRIRRDGPGAFFTTEQVIAGARKEPHIANA